MKRRIIGGVVLSLMLLSLCACAGSKNSSDNQNISNNTTTSESQSEASASINASSTSTNEVSDNSIDTEEIIEEIIEETVNNDWLELDEQLGKLTNVQDNIWMNDDEKYAELTVSLNNIIATQGIAGTLVVATDHDVIYTSGTGAYDIYGNLVSMDTTYGIGSINKTFTAACIMKLMEEGKIGLDDTIDKYFPNFQHGSEITVYQLLHMCSGLPGIGLSKGPETTRQDRFEMVLYGEYYDNYFFDKIIYPCALDFEPGSEMRYCNTNYFLLANIIEIVSGQTYAEYVTENIIEPLGLTGTSLGCVQDLTSRTADPDFTPLYMSTMEKTLKGYGAMHSKPLDILMFDRAIFNEGLFSSEYVDIMTEMKFDYGCGWMSEDYELCHYNPLGKPSPTRNIYHDGAVYSFRTSNCVLNAEGERLYIIWFNSSYTDLNPLIYDACMTYINTL